MKIIIHATHVKHALTIIVHVKIIVLLVKIFAHTLTIHWKNSRGLGSLTLSCMGKHVRVENEFKPWHGLVLGFDLPQATLCMLIH